MIYLTAQPNENYFAWQLGVQALSFKRIGIKPSDVYHLVGIKNGEELNSSFLELKKMYGVNIIPYTYNSNPKYIPCIRPYLIAEFLEDSTITADKSTFLYIDSDVVFTAPLNLEKELQSEVCYLSNCYRYLSSDAILDDGGQKLLEDMCNIVGIEPKIVQLHNFNTGGAQSLLKNTTAEFWRKVQKDSEELFIYLKKVLPPKNKSRVDRTYKDIQPWCADMWALQWNLWKYGYKTKISDELQFSWATDPIWYWDKFKIYHNAGAAFTNGSRLFQKTHYKALEPYNIPLKDINDTLCNFNYAKMVTDFYNYKRNK